MSNREALRQQYDTLMTHVMDMDVPPRLRAAMMQADMAVAGEALRLSEPEWYAKKGVGAGAVMALTDFFGRAGLSLAQYAHAFAPKPDTISLRAHFSEALGLPPPRRKVASAMLDRMTRRHFESFRNVHGDAYAVHFFSHWPAMTDAAAQLHNATLDSARVRELLQIRDDSPNEFRYIQARHLLQLANKVQPMSLTNAMDNIVEVAKKMRHVTVARDVRSFELSYGLSANYS